MSDDENASFRKRRNFLKWTSFGKRRGGGEEEGCRWKKPKEDTSSFIREKTAPKNAKERETRMGGSANGVAGKCIHA